MDELKSEVSAKELEEGRLRFLAGVLLFIKEGGQIPVTVSPCVEKGKAVVLSNPYRLIVNSEEEIQSTSDHWGSILAAFDKREKEK